MSYGRWYTEAENRFSVPKSQWAKWSRTARVVFNDAYMARRAADVVHVREKVRG